MQLSSHTELTAAHQSHYLVSQPNSIIVTWETRTSFKHPPPLSRTRVPVCCDCTSCLVAVVVFNYVHHFPAVNALLLLFLLRVHWSCCPLPPLTQHFWSQPTPRMLTETRNSICTRPLLHQRPLNTSRRLHMLLLETSVNHPHLLPLLFCHELLRLIHPFAQASTTVTTLLHAHFSSILPLPALH